MSLYYYRAVDSQGLLLKGYISGENLRNAREKLSFMRLEPFVVRRCWLTKHSPKDLAIFLKYLGYALEAGHALAPALALLQESFHGFLQKVIFSIHQKVLYGSLLSEALCEYPSLFAPPLVALFQLGEKSGKLASVCHQASAYVTQAQAQRASLWKSLMHPLLNVVFLLGALGMLVAFLLPEVLTLFDEAHLSYPLATQILIFFSSFSWPLALGGLGIGIALCLLFSSTRLAFYLPLIGPYRLQQHYTRFFSALALLLQEKMPLVSAIPIACRGAKLPLLHHLFQDLVHQIQKGHHFYQALESFPHLPSFYKSLIQVGELTGQQCSALGSAAKLMHQDLQRRVERITAWLPPLLMVAVGLGFWLLVEGTLFPLYEFIGKASYGF